MSLNREGHEEVVYFVGTEIEHTPAFGLKTLFVVNNQKVENIVSYAEKEKVNHIYLAANCSFKIGAPYDKTAKALLDLGYRVTLDYPITAHDWVVENYDLSIFGHKNFIVIISCKIQKVETLSKNLVIKIDDKDFKYSNTGVWCHNASSLTDSNRFTPWNEYGNDVVLFSTQTKKKEQKLEENLSHLSLEERLKAKLSLEQKKETVDSLLIKTTSASVDLTEIKEKVEESSNKDEDKIVEEIFEESINKPIEPLEKETESKDIIQEKETITSAMIRGEFPPIEFDEEPSQEELNEAVATLTSLSASVSENSLDMAALVKATPAKKAPSKKSK